MANKEKLLTAAQKFLSKGQIPKAISEYQKLVEAFPKDVRNRQKLAEILSRDKRNEDALTEYEVVAKHYTETGFYLKAIAVFKQMQKIEPSRVDIYHRLAELNEKQGLVGNALTEYRNLVSFYDKNEMHQESIEVLEKMASLDPENLNFSAKIAECYMASGRKEEAFEKFQTIIEPLVTKGEHVKVVKLYERFLDICPDDVSSRLPLARALINSGSFEKSIKLLQSLLKHSPEDADVNRCLTDAYVANQDYANARLTLKHLLKQSDGDLDLREYYARICIDAGEVERARDRLEEWKDAFFQAERVAVLQGFYEELKELLVGDALVAETLSVIYEAVGDTAKLDDLDVPEDVAVVADETADSALLDDAIDDVETLDMVGEEADSDVEVPSLDPDGPAEKTAAVGIELDLDLDLELEVAAPEPEEPLAAVEVEPEVAPEPEAEAAEDIEVEVELDLEGMDDLDLDFDEEPAVVEDEQPEVIAEEPEAEEEELTFATEVSEEIGVDVSDDSSLPEPPDITDDLELSFDDDALEIAAAPEQEPELEPLDVVAEVEELETVEELDASEVLMELDDVEALEEVEELETVEEPDASEVLMELDDVEALEEVEELETLEEVEELETLEEVEEPETLEEVEELETLEEVEELETLEEVEELEALDEVEGSSALFPAARMDFTNALNVDAELEEAEFYLQQGLYDDAARVVRTLMEYCPDLPDLQAKMDEIEQRRQAAETESESAEFVDLMSDLQDDDLLAATDFLDSFGGEAQESDELSQKLVSELDSADTESHYNLGIAYKEMGLYDDAIAEFDKATSDPVRAVDCITLIGQCHLESGDADKAMTVFKSALAHESLTEEGRLTLNFEVGMLHQMNGQLLEALESFQLVADKDSFFRDVAELIKNLRRELGLDDSDDDDGPQGNRDRVSYV